MAYAFSLLGLVSITASLSVMIWAIEPLIILFLAGWFLRERIGLSLVVLSLVALGGLVLVIGAAGRDRESRRRPADDRRGRLLRLVHRRHASLADDRLLDDRRSSSPSRRMPSRSRSSSSPLSGSLAALPGQTM